MPTSVLLGIPPLLGLGLALVMAMHAWRHKTGPGWRPLILFGLSVAWWCGWEAVWVMVEDPLVRLRISQIQYLGITTAPVFWFLVAQSYGLSYGTAPSRLRGWWRGLLFVPAAITVALVFTNGSHGLIWSSMEPGEVGMGGVRTPVVTYGAAFYGHALYAYGLAVVAAWMLVVRFLASPLYRRQLVVVVSGTAFLLAVNLVHLAGLVAIPMDPTPPAFALVMASLAWVSSRHRFFELVPVARGLLVEELRDGLLVSNAQGVIVDANPAAHQLLSPWRSGLVGVRLDTILPGETAGLLEGTVELRVEAERVLELRITTLPGPSDLPEARVVLIRDVTEEREAAARLRRTREELGALNRELERLALTDALTGLANRRRLLGELDREWARSERSGQGLALLLLDLDRFKEVNDTHGHLAGDAVLESMGAALTAEVRPQDLAARFGGEELAILLTGTDLESATAVSLRVLEVLRSRVHRGEDGATFHVTASGGLAVREPGDSGPRALMARADRALYHAKDAGRDRLGLEAAGGLRQVRVTADSAPDSGSRPPEEATPPLLPPPGASATPPANRE